jgi:hypothetical protein
LVLEEVAAVAVLVAILVLTLLLLGMQWLSSGPQQAAAVVMMGAL